MLQNIIDDLKNQGIEPDLAQSNLLSELINTTPRNKSLINRIKKKKSQIRSFYVWGDVGRGKTFTLFHSIQMRGHDKIIVRIGVSWQINIHHLIKIHTRLEIKKRFFIF